MQGQCYNHRISPANSLTETFQISINAPGQFRTLEINRCSGQVIVRGFTPALMAGST